MHAHALVVCQYESYSSEMSASFYMSLSVTTAGLSLRDFRQLSCPESTWFLRQQARASTSSHRSKKPEGKHMIAELET